LHGGSNVDIARLRGCETSFLALWKEHTVIMIFEVLTAISVKMAVLRDVHDVTSMRTANIL
jgi:hypothetical protein